VGELAAELGIDCVISVGDEAAMTAEAASRGGVEKVRKAGSTDEAARLLQEFVKAGDVVLVKGSRSAQMERVVEAMQTP
jgi:UDP-N-acetylmuramoyl-tripeptide--D-alanyl-D-alanine ligase